MDPRDERSLQHWSQEVDEYYRLKFVLAARLEILWRLWASKLELIALGQRLAGQPVALPPLEDLLGRQGRKAVGWPAAEMPFARELKVLATLQDQLTALYQKFNPHIWAAKIYRKAVEAVQIDLDIYLLPHQSGAHGYAQYDGLWARRDFIDPCPLTTHENARLAELRGRYQKLWQDQKLALLARPYLTEVSWVRPWNFYWESREPSYYFYQYLVALVYAPQAREFMFLAHDRHNFYPATAAQIASKINLPAQVRDYKRGEVQQFFAPAAAHLRQDLQALQTPSWEAIKLTKQALQELVTQDLAAVDRSLQQVLAASTLPWDDEWSLFAHRKAIFKEFAWLGQLPALATLVEAQLPGEVNLDYLSNQRHLAALQKLAWAQEEKAQHDWVGLGIMAAAITTSFVPFGSWISPALWVTAASYDLGMAALPQYLQAKGQQAFGQALRGDLLALTARPELRFTPEESLAKQQLAVQKKADLAIATVIDTPLLFLGGRSFVKNMRRHLAWAQVQEAETASWRTWFSTHAYQTMYDQGWQLEDLQKLSRWQMLKMMATEKLDFTMLVTFTGFGAAMLAMHLMDQQQAKTDAAKADLKSAENPLGLLELIPVDPPQPRQALHLVQALSYRFKKMGVLQHIFYLEEFSKIPTNLTEAKFRFYEGTHIVLLFDTIYLPVAVLSSVNQDYSFDDLAVAVAEKVILEKLLESALVSAVLQKVQGDYWQEIWQGSPDDENGRRFFGQNLLFAAHHLLAQQWPDHATQAPARAAELAQRYRNVTAHLSLEGAAP
jgi:hypothetical protein